MDSQEIKQVIAKYFKSIKKYFDKLENGFERDELYLLWHEMKRLRAFLRLINLELSEEIELKLPIEMKTIYGYIGIIREFQWLLHQMNSIEKQEQKKHPVYVKHLNDEIETWKAKLQAAVSKNPLTDAEAKILTRIPHSIHQNTIEKFVRQKINTINSILSEDHTHAPDEKLHAIRKNLRDIFYNIHIFKHDLGKAFPIKLWNETELLTIENLTHDLELFNDLCTAIDFLEPIHLVEINTPEKTSLALIKKRWLITKKLNKQNILSQLDNYQHSIEAQVIHNQT